MGANIFPNLRSGTWAKINLDEEAVRTTVDLTNPKTCMAWVDALHKARGVSYSYGGFLENRSTLWKDHYNKKTAAFVHLGLDYNVPSGTEIALPLDARVVHIMRDKDQSGGWGGRVLMALSDMPLYVVYGHLKKDIALSVGRVYKAGEIAGVVGESKENGGWYPHLHVQVMDDFFLDRHRPNLDSIDGYLQADHPLLKHVVNPENLIII